MGFHIWWAITAAMGFGFLIYTGFEWHKLIYEDGLTLGTNLFGSTYYSLVGLHASHVLVGFVLLSMILIFSLTGKLQHRHHEHVEIVSWYWHFVDGVWAVVVLVVYIIGGNSLQLLNTDPEENHHEGVELPTPTPRPIVAALGIMLIAAGVVPNIVLGLARLLPALVG